MLTWKWGLGLMGNLFRCSGNKTKKIQDIQIKTKTIQFNNARNPTNATAQTGLEFVKWLSGTEKSLLRLPPDSTFKTNVGILDFDMSSPWQGMRCNKVYIENNIVYTVLDCSYVTNWGQSTGYITIIGYDN